MAAVASPQHPVAPAPSPPPPPALRLVGPRRHVGRYVVTLVVVGAIGVFGCVTLNAFAAKQSFAARTLQVEVDELAMRYDELTVDVAALESPRRVRRVAVRRLGMVPALAPAFLVLDDPRPEAGDATRANAAPAAATAAGAAGD